MPRKPKASPAASALPAIVEHKGEARALSTLTPYARNSRIHSPEQVAQLVASMRTFGFTIPVLIDEAGEIIAGHGRVLAAEKLGLAEVPVIVATGWSEAQKRAYVIADNKLAMNATWDDALLRIELDALKGFDFDLGLTGFSAVEIGDLFAPAAEGRAPQTGSLADRFMIPPFSVVNAREGWWQDRKRAWIDLGIQSELGRGATAVNSPHEGHGMADGLVAVRAAQKRAAMNKSASFADQDKLNALQKRRRKPDATPGGSAPHAADYSKGERGDGRGRAIG